jgi:hypothetical protein
MPAITQAAKDYDAALQKMASEKAMRSDLELQKLQLDLQEKIRETPESKIALAEDMAMRREALRQKQQGIEFGDVAKNAALQENLSLLDASKKQGAADIQNRMFTARDQAMENILMGGKGLVPTATVNMGGVKQQVLPEQAGRTGANIYGQIYQTQVPQLAATYEAEGQPRDTAIRMASADVRSKLTGAASSGKIPLIAANGNPIFITVPQAAQLLSSDTTPQFMKNQIEEALGGKEQPVAASWIKSRLGR